MEDLEALKVIKEREESVTQETERIKLENEKKLEELRSSLAQDLLSTEEYLKNKFQQDIEQVRAEAQKKADIIIEESRAKANNMKIKISDSDIEKYVNDSLTEFMERF